VSWAVSEIRKRPLLSVLLDAVDVSDYRAEMTDVGILEDGLGELVLKAWPFSA